MTAFHYIITIFSVELLFAIVLQIAKYRLPKKSNESHIKAISFIIPFHNEADRILPLIQSINASEFTGECEFIFVDDYSTDDTEKLLKENLKVPYICLKNEHKRGKKSAIRQAIHSAKHEMINTWDADIHFKSDYIQNLFALPMADLLILPVEMTSHTLAGKLACIEFTFIQTFNQGYAGMHKPIACNGANLGFRKSVFLEMEEQRTDYNISSGDDMFLFWKMLEANKDIATYKSKALEVSTPAPNTFLAVLRQRQRWKSKLTTMSFKTMLTVLLWATIMSGVALTIYVATFKPIFLALFLIKFVAELVASWSFVRQKFSHFFVLILHQFWYPIYALLLLLPLGKEKKWS